MSTLTDSNDIFDNPSHNISNIDVKDKTYHSISDIDVQDKTFGQAINPTLPVPDEITISS